MDKEIAVKKLLFDIIGCIDNIESYLGEKRIFKNYDETPMLQDAVERNLITIGEATNALLKISNTIEITNARRIVDARNKLTHGYDEIDSTQIWSIIINHLPLLKKEVEDLLNQ